MRFAILGDIHGNLPALEAAYGAAVSHGAEKIYHLGDLGGYAPFINEVADFVIGHGIEGVQGNYDESVGYDHPHCGCRAEDPLHDEMMGKGFAWTKARATEKTKEYLRGLPAVILFACEGLMVSLFHATPSKNNLYWTSDRDDGFFMKMAAKADADVMVYGHTHIAYRKDIGGKVFINAGSVGKPKDRDARSCVVIIDIAAGRVETEFLRAAYDVREVASAIVENGLPGYFAERLIEGR